MVAILQWRFRLSKRQTKLFIRVSLESAGHHRWLTKLKNRVTDNLRPAYNELLAVVPQRPRLGIDETPWKECHANTWIWTFVNRTFTFLKMAASRKREELVATAGMYHSLKHVQYCWAPRERDIQTMADCRDPVASWIGEASIKNTSILFRQYHRYRIGTSGFAGLKSSLGKVRREVETLLVSGLGSAHSKTSGTCQKLYWERHRLWTFLDGHNGGVDPIEPTNNAIECSL